jgi:hypothetical protein
MEDLRSRDLTADEVAALPEATIRPDEAPVLYTRATGTYDGTRYDGIDPSALFDCFFGCPMTFQEFVAWYGDRLAKLGWPGGVAELDGNLPWHRWTRGKEQIDLIDFTTSDWTAFPTPPTGWLLLRMNYTRKPARDFASDDEYQAWFTDSGDKGERWRNRARGR